MDHREENEESGAGLQRRGQEPRGEGERAVRGSRQLIVRPSAREEGAHARSQSPPSWESYYER